MKKKYEAEIKRLVWTQLPLSAGGRRVKPRLSPLSRTHLPSLMFSYMFVFVQMSCRARGSFIFWFFLNDNGLKTQHGFLFPHLLSPLWSPCVLRSPSSSDLWLSELLLVCIMSSPSPRSIFSSRSPWSPRPAWHKKFIGQDVFRHRLVESDREIFEDEIWWDILNGGDVMKWDEMTVN